MRRHLVLSLAVLFIAFGVPSNAQSDAEPTSAAAPAAAGALPVVFYDVNRIATFMLNCSASRPAGAGTYVWRKNGTLVEDVLDLRNRYKLEDGGAVFQLQGRALEDDFGNYSCAVGDAAPASQWELRGRPHAKLPHNSNVVEKQTIKLSCKLVGKPYPAVTWVFNSSDGANSTDVRALGERVKLQRSEQGVENGELVLADAERADAGAYICLPPDGTSAFTTLRVKDQYAALWPFLGICAEVFVLCAIILVYEKRRTKPELDDSDTDNHDQKKS